MLRPRATRPSDCACVRGRIGALLSPPTLGAAASSSPNSWNLEPPGACYCDYTDAPLLPVAFLMMRPTRATRYASRRRRRPPLSARRAGTLSSCRSSWSPPMRPASTAFRAVSGRRCWPSAELPASGDALCLGARRRAQRGARRASSPRLPRRPDHRRRVGLTGSDSARGLIVAHPGGASSSRSFYAALAVCSRARGAGDGSYIIASVMIARVTPSASRRWRRTCSSLLRGPRRRSARRRRFRRSRRRRSRAATAADYAAPVELPYPRSSSRSRSLSLRRRGCCSAVRRRCRADGLTAALGSPRCVASAAGSAVRCAGRAARCGRRGIISCTGWVPASSARGVRRWSPRAWRDAEQAAR